MFSGPMPMAEFRKRIWDQAFGGGDPLRDIAPGLDRSPDRRHRNRRPAPAQALLGQPRIGRALHLLLPDPHPDHRPAAADPRRQDQRSLRDAPALHPSAGIGLRHHLSEPVHAELLPPKGGLQPSMSPSSVARCNTAEPPTALPTTGKKVAIIGGGPAAWRWPGNWPWTGSRPISLKRPTRSAAS